MNTNIAIRKLIGNRSIVVLLLFTLLLTACAAPPAPQASSQASEGGEAAPAAQTRSRLVVAGPFMTDILDAQQSYEGGPLTVEQIGQALMRIDSETSELIPDLAESWTFSEDNLKITVTLPEDAIYSNGDPLDAQAVADALLRNKDVSPYASDFEALSDVAVVDAATFEMIFSDPPAAFLTVLNSAFGGPWNVAAAQEMGNEAFAVAPVASGPLVVKDFSPGSELLLARNENYRTNLPFVENKGPLHLEEVVVRVIPEDLTLAGELETGAVDLVFNAPASAIERLRANPEITVIERRLPGLRGLAMNLEHPFFSDLLVRQAIAKAVDRDSLIKVLSGAAPIHAFITPGMVAYSPETEAYGQGLHPHDVAAAQALMAEAGWSDSDGDGIVEKDGEPFAVELLIASDAVDEQQASQILQAQLRAIGIDIQISQQDRGYAFEAKAAGDYDMGFENYGWPDPDILSVVFGAPFWNFPQYDNPELIEKMVTARYMMDAAERTAAYAEIQQVLLDEVVEIPLWQGTTYAAVRNAVQGLIVTADGKMFLNDVTIVEP